jgi:hypothetical protein
MNGRACARAYPERWARKDRALGPLEAWDPARYVRAWVLKSYTRL